MRAPEVITALPGKLGSCWTAAAPNTAYRKLEGSQTVEVAVVGAGIVGTTAAYLLSEAGLSVALLEARRIAHPSRGGATWCPVVGQMNRSMAIEFEREATRRLGTSTWQLFLGDYSTARR